MERTVGITNNNPRWPKEFEQKFSNQFNEDGVLIDVSGFQNDYFGQTFSRPAVLTLSETVLLPDQMLHIVYGLSKKFEWISFPVKLSVWWPRIEKTE